MKRGKTAQHGEKTKTHARYSTVMISNQDPEYDYSLQRKKDIEEGGSSSDAGWEAIGEHNYNGEVFGNLPKQFQSRVAGAKRKVYLDTIACKRPKELGRWFKMQEDEKYNAQISFVNSASVRLKKSLRKLDPDAVVLNQGSSSGPGMTQRKGPTQEER